MTNSDRRMNLERLILEKTGINIKESCYENHYFSKEANRIFGDIDSPANKDMFLYLCYFVEQLEKIKNYNRKDFRSYLSKLGNDGTNIKGEKFEILTYSRLIDSSLQFSKPKYNPDFELRFGKESVYIECGSRQADKVGYFIKSIEQAIVDKQVKGISQNYANINTALHIEVSTTVYNSHGNEDFLEFEDLKDIAKEMIQTVDYGAIVLICTFYSQENEMVYGHPIIVYKEDCNNNLKKVHEKMFPLQRKKVTPILKPYL